MEGKGASKGGLAGAYGTNSCLTVQVICTFCFSKEKQKENENLFPKFPHNFFVGAIVGDGWRVAGGGCWVVNWFTLGTLAF